MDSLLLENWKYNPAITLLPCPSSSDISIINVDSENIYILKKKLAVL